MAEKPSQSANRSSYRVVIMKAPMKFIVLDENPIISAKKSFWMTGPFRLSRKLIQYK